MLGTDARERCLFHDQRDLETRMLLRKAREDLCGHSRPGAQSGTHRHADRRPNSSKTRRTGRGQRSRLYLQLTADGQQRTSNIIHIIAQKFLARELILTTAEIQDKAFDETIDVDDLMQEAEGKLFEISQRNLKKDVTRSTRS